MDKLLDAPETRALWEEFLGLSAVPRGSKEEAAAADWVAERGRALGCEVLRDEIGNVLLRKNATKGMEGRPTVALQAHVDMVCEKNEGTVHDFRKDPIKPVLEGDWLRASGTTLGADNGIGVAAALAVAARNDVAHGPLEILVTVDEETGLTGAMALEQGWLKARYLLNLDSEDPGVATIGCAGGVDTVSTRELSFGPPPAGTACLRVKVSGLKGGHSGIDIGSGRGNAIRILASTLGRLMKGRDVRVADVSGGNKRNAIAREAQAVVFVPEGDVAAVKVSVAESLSGWREILGAGDPGLAIAVEPGTASRVMSVSDARAAVDAILAIPHGVEEMSPAIPGLVQTSTNLGVVKIEGSKIEITNLTRSSVDAAKYALDARIRAAATMAGFSCAEDNLYPGWNPNPESALVGIVSKCWKAMSGKDMKVEAIHAGLECGIIGGKHPGLDMVSIGPTLKDVHTPDERVNVPSVAEFWLFLKSVLAAI